MLNLSPALYEAKLELEAYKARYFVKKADKNGFLFSVLANPEAENAEEIENEYERLFDVYDQIAMRDAKANGVCAMKVMRYMDEEYDAYVRSESEWDGSEPEYESIYGALCSENTMSTWEGQRYGRYY